MQTIADAGRSVPVPTGRLDSMSGQAAPNAAPAPRGWSLTVKPIIPGHLYRVRNSGIDVDALAPSPFDAIERLLEQVMSCSG